MFAIIISITLGVVIWAAKQTKTTADFVGDTKGYGARLGFHF